MHKNSAVKRFNHFNTFLGLFVVITAAVFVIGGFATGKKPPFAWIAVTCGVYTALSWSASEAIKSLLSDIGVASSENPSSAPTPPEDE